MSLGRQTRDGATVRRVQVMLDDATIERAKALGDGNLSIGLRKMAKEAEMTTYNVYANACEFGLVKAETAQEARGLAAQMAGYESEAEMEERLGQPSEIVAEEAVNAA